MADVKILAGTWEEIVSHAGELSGRQLRVIVFDSETGETPHGAQSSAEEEALLDAVLAESQDLPVLPLEANGRAWLYEEHD